MVNSDLKVKVRTSEEISYLLSNTTFTYCSNRSRNCYNLGNEIDMLFLNEVNGKLLCSICYGDIFYQIERNKTDRWLSQAVNQVISEHVRALRYEMKINPLSKER